MASPSGTSPVAYPVRSLREQCTALEAVIALVLVTPGKKVVHHLRTSTRRVEAQMQILELMQADEAGLASLLKKTSKVKKLLGEVRRAAGKVRDLDVQRELIKTAQDQATKRIVKEDGKRLRSRLKTQRAEEADTLVTELEGHARKLAPRLEKLLQRLEPAANLALTPARTSKLIRGWYGTSGTEIDSSEKSLHGIRKVSKLARYMAEARGNEALARDFEETQQLGGTWHDALMLREVAQQELGSRTKLVRLFAQSEQAALKKFQAHLAAIKAGV